MAVAQKLAVKLFVAGCQNRDVFDLDGLETRTSLLFRAFDMFTVDVCVLFLVPF